MRATPKIEPSDLWFDHSKIPKHHFDLDVEFGKLKDVLAWCESSCRNNYRYTPLYYGHDGVTPDVTNAGYRFYFKSKKDLLLFELKWA